MLIYQLVIHPLGGPKRARRVVPGKWTPEWTPK